VSLPTSRQPTSTHSATSDGQLLKGSSENDKLIGFGKPGSGTGTIVGGAGDDTYVVWSSKHRVIENAGEGVDTVQSHWTYTLPENVENLTLVGKGPNSATGNELNNIVIGNANKNVINGGAGDDVLTGGGGNDTFFVSGKDTITDFSAGDRVNLQDFTSFTNFAKVKAAMARVGSDTLLKLNANESVLFKNMGASQFTSDMFVLGNPVDNYKLVFADEFDTFKLNLGTGSTDNWHPLYPRSGLSAHTVIGRSVQYFTYAGDEGTYGQPVGVDPFSLKNGILTITMDRVAPEDQWKVYGYDYTSGNITSIGSFHQTYGYFEIRAKLAAGTGLHDAFWMLPMDGSWPPELDIVEARGVDPSRVIGGVHSGESTSSAAVSVPTATTEFHTYGLDWEPDFLTWYVDGVAVRTIATPAGLDVPMYLLANLGGGSEWAGKPDEKTPFPAKMQIDYIRAYASENTLERNGPSNKVGTSGDDTMHGTSGDDILNGGAGDDKLYGGAGNDTLIGGGGKDLLDGGFGDDIYVASSGKERISEGGVKGNDTVKTALPSYTLGLNLENLVFTGTGTFNGAGNVENNVITGSAAGGTLSGHAGNDRLIGGGGIDTLNGGAGDDIAYGYGGNDTLRGNDGNDQLFAGDGNDKVGGDAGDDLLDGGRGDDNLSGGDGNDTLIGGDGNDKLDGGAGIDTMNGGSGDDSYFVDDPADIIIEAAGGGNDTVRVFANSYVLSANVEVMSYGGAGNFKGTGNEIANRISGGAGNDVLDGKGGADILTGGAGNDRFLFTRGQAAGDKVTDFHGAGIAGGDKLVFSGFGNGTVNRLGSSDSYVIKADAANGGGSETIQIAGVTNLSAGDYEFDGATTTNLPPTDVIASNLAVKGDAASGTRIGLLSAIDPDAGDTVNFRLVDDAGGRFKLSGSALILVKPLANGVGSSHVVKVQATDSAGNAFTKSLTVTVTKATVDTTFRGTAGDDSFTYSTGLGYSRIDGLGGTDTLTMTANKLAVSAQGLDVKFDIRGNGSAGFSATNFEHLVLSGRQISFTGSVASTSLTAGGITITGTDQADTLDATLSDVRIVASGGLGNDIIKGSSQADTLAGGAGSDKLYAMGGADTLLGGVGNDTYYLDDPSQTVIEYAGEGTDRVIVKFDYALGEGVENLTLAGTQGHAGTGNWLKNTIVGSGGDDVLDGKGGADSLFGGDGDDVLIGGAGADLLVGGAGADTFRFTVLGSSADMDTIRDFGRGADRIEFAKWAFTALSSGALDPAEFRLGTAATTADQHIIYDRATGALYYDADGVGGQAQVQVALLSDKPALDAGAFFVI
jgi:Ca2+-binding RTX toxin-like protein